MRINAISGVFFNANAELSKVCYDETLRQTKRQILVRQ